MLVARLSFLALPIALLLTTINLRAADPLHRRIDNAIVASFAGPVAARSSEAEFLRRVWLDLAGTIPTAAEARGFLNDKSPDKRRRLIERLLASTDYPRRMQQVFSVMLLERRLGKTVAAEDWEQYLRTSFETNKPLDRFVQEMLAADGTDPASRPGMKFYLVRSATDFRLLSRDVSRLFLGRNLECAQCHDHPTVEEYAQRDFFGIVAFLNRSYLYRDKKTSKSFFVEKENGSKVEFTSVFTGETMKTGPRLPGGTEIDVPFFETGKGLMSVAESGRPPIAKFRLRPRFAKQLASGSNEAFTQNTANRLWALMMGRGLVHPLDMRHRGNPPSHPELLKLLATDLAARKFNVREFLRELALSETYQRSSYVRGVADKVPPSSFAVFNMKPLSAEQLAFSMMRATGNLERVLAVPSDKSATAKYRPDKGREMPAVNLDNVLKLYRSIYAGQPGEAEEGFNPSLAGALFVANEKLLLRWLTPAKGNLVDRLLKLGDVGAVSEELYLSVLTRLPTAEERAAVAAYLKKNPDGREEGLREMAWALLASSEFRLNH